MIKKLFSRQNLSSLFFYLSILIFIIGFNFSDTPLPTGWYQQFMPSPTGGTLRDIAFIDSLVGFAVTDSCILKTINSGDNWSIKLQGYYIFERIQFLNANIGFACAGNNQLLKTINSGENWTSITLPDIYPYDMSVWNQDTIWLVNPGGFGGGVFRTTNGGASWQLQLNLGNQNPNHIYFFDRNIGYISEDNSYIRKTTDCGQTWNIISSTEGFSKIYFIDNNTGWKFYIQMEKTTNGGQTWVLQPRPTGGGIYILGIPDFSIIGNDTIWSPSGYIAYPNNQVRGVLFRSTSGGNNWLIQIPDTTIHIGSYDYSEFSDNLRGWIYRDSPTGIHTITGGDSIFYVPVQQISSEIPKDFELKQNYPNPFNASSKFKVQVSKLTDVKVKVYDIGGKLITTLINQKLSSGIYEAEFNGSNYSSGVYFYSLFADDKLIDTKKLILIK